MKAALHILGYDDVYHGTDVYSNIKDCDMWIDALNAKYFAKRKPFGRAEFDKLLGHCAAITDGPANCFGPELMDAYPDAKVVLVERDFDAVSIKGALVSSPVLDLLQICSLSGISLTLTPEACSNRKLLTPVLCSGSRASMGLLRVRTVTSFAS